MKFKTLEITVFLTGAAVMMLEIVGIRVLAPYVGNSIFVWTALIGVILAALSTGYWTGGAIADRYPRRSVLSGIILASAVWIALMSLSKNAVLVVISEIFSGVRAQAVVSSLALFAVPSVLLGMVSPHAVRIAMRDVHQSGKTAGKLYAISTVGSIVGTFVCGFWLLTYFGNTRVLSIISGVLFIAAIVLSSSLWKSKVSVLTAILIAGVLSVGSLVPIGPDVLADTDSLYQRIIVKDFEHDGRPARALFTTPNGVQSVVYLDNPSELVAEYTRHYRLAKYLDREVGRVLIVGGAGYSVPRDVLSWNENVRVDVVEIDSVMTEIAEKYFFLDRSEPRLQIYHEDARNFFRRAPANYYDAVMIDAFHGLSVPFQLTTKESMEEVRRVLRDDGGLILNMISATEGDASRFAWAERATLEEVFSLVEMFALGDKEPEEVQNIVFLAVKKESVDVPEEFSVNRFSGDKQQQQVLTDDFAPVDQYLMKTF